MPYFMNEKKIAYSTIRCIVTDMDGTLLNNEKQLDDDIRDVVKQLKERNILFTLASGRNVQIMKHFIQDLGINIPYIVNNGACIYKGECCLFEQTMEEDDLSKALTIYEEEAISYIAYTSQTVYVHGSHQPLELFLERLKGKTNICYDMNIAQIAKKNIFKVVAIHSSTKEMQHIQAKINETCVHLQCLRSEDHLYTITHKDASKGIALKRIMKDLGIELSQVLVFGDNFNDVSMFEVAGVSIAMENSQDDIKQCADNITTYDNHHQGVSRFLKEFILK